MKHRIRRLISARPQPDAGHGAFGVALDGARDHDLVGFGCAFQALRASAFLAESHLLPVDHDGLVSAAEEFASRVDHRAAKLAGERRPELLQRRRPVVFPKEHVLVNHLSHLARRGDDKRANNYKRLYRSNWKKPQYSVIRAYW